MFEISVALKYLLPKKKAISTALISLLSIFVISLVVWLVIVFLSVTTGIEKNWLRKLTTLNAPLRISPTDAYFNSYYYQIDKLSSASQYAFKSIGEKAASTLSDPYSVDVDMELPARMPKPEYGVDGNLKDPVKRAIASLENLKKTFPELVYDDYEMSGALLRLGLTRTQQDSFFQQEKTSFLSQMSYLVSLTQKNPSLPTLILKPQVQDLQNLLLQLGKDADQMDVPRHLPESSALPQRLKAFFFHIKIKKVTTSSGKTWDVSSVDFSQAQELSQVKIHVSNQKGEKIIPFKNIQLAEAEAITTFASEPSVKPLWPYFCDGKQHLPKMEETVGILLPKSYKDNGVLVGDKGYLSYLAATGVSTQEQRLLCYVAGFYDPGIMPVGNRCLLVPEEITRTINASSTSFSPDGSPTNGILVWINAIKNAPLLKQKLEGEFLKEEIAPYFKVATYKEYEFSKDLMQQFQSDRTLFTLIATIIIIVACCNIISLLVLLVNDKKKEIAILSAMGATQSSIAAIFGICGTFMGLFSSLIGTGAAILTLKRLDVLVAFLSKIQGHAAFQTAFFGSSLPNELSKEALIFVLIATPIISLLAGLIPAIKAARLRPSSILRSE